MKSTVQNFSAGKFQELLLPCPPLTEQRTISAFLDRETVKIDALIAEQEKLIALLAEKRQATISHAVTRGLNPDSPMKDSGVAWLGEVPAHWKVCPLKLISRIGNGSTPNRDNPAYWGDEGFPWLNSSVVNQEEVSEAERFVTDLALKECHLPIVEPPAVLVGITGQGKTRGMATRLAFTATVNQHLAYVKPAAGTLSEAYLLRAFEAVYQHLRTESEGAGSTKGAITCEQLGNLKIPAPELAEQQAIAAFLDREIAKLDALKHTSFATDFTRQDAAILNIQRACEAALDMGQHLIRREKLGVPQSARDVFVLLAQGGWINATLADGLKRMVGFRNIAVHDYQALQLPITVSIIENHLDEFLHYSQALLLRDAAQPGV